MTLIFDGIFLQRRKASVGIGKTKLISIKRTMRRDVFFFFLEGNCFWVFLQNRFLFVVKKIGSYIFLFCKNKTNQFNFYFYFLTRNND